jgi:hypothetical protein
MTKRMPNTLTLLRNCQILARALMGLRLAVRSASGWPPARPRLGRSISLRGRLHSLEPRNELEALLPSLAPGLRAGRTAGGLNLCRVNELLGRFPLVLLTWSQQTLQPRSYER